MVIEQEEQVMVDDGCRLVSWSGICIANSDVSEIKLSNNGPVVT